MNNLKIFNFDVSDIKIGTEKVKAVMLGGRRHWPLYDEKDYFAIVANSDSAIKFSKAGLSYSKDEGNTWTTLPANVAIPLNEGEKMMFRGTPTGSGSAPYGIGSFSGSTGDISAEGNIMSLTYGADFADKTDLTPRGTFCLSSIFRDCTCLTSIDNLKMPATTLTQQCYYALFWGCTGLVEVPADLLPATEMKSLCYQEMFRGCTNLKKAPVLPAETMVDRCYYYLFYGCTNLEEITCYQTGATIPTTTHTDHWVDGVAPNGKFYKNPDEEKTTPWNRSVNGIPVGWNADGVEGYLAIKAVEPSTVKFSNACFYSLDSGATWSAYTANQAVQLNEGEKVMFQGTLNPNTSSEPYGIGCFSGSTGNIEVEGNPISMIYGDNFMNILSLDGKTFAFASMFRNCTALTSCERIELVADVMSTDCYYSMFKGCTNLTRIMDTLSASTLANYCYNNMFSECTKLEKAPKLPAKKVPVGAYGHMFTGCTSLNEIWCYATDITADSCVVSWVNGVAPSGTFHRDPANTNWTINSVNGVPVNWELDPPTDYFKITALESSIIKFSKNGLSGSTDSGKTWFSMGTTGVAIEPGQEIWLKSTIAPSGSAPYGIGSFSGSSGSFKVGGNIMSLLYGDEASGPLKTRSFSHLFDYCPAIVSAEDLILPATTMAASCYDCMFYDCPNLKKAPKVLPATTLVDGCYYAMFALCTSLEESPIIMAETAVGGAGTYMFSGCTSLSAITCMYANTINGTGSWVSGVSPTGVFHKNPDKITYWDRGVNQIPVGWEVPENDDYFTVVAESTGTVKTNISATYASVNGGAWTQVGTNAINVNVGDEIRYEMTVNPSSDSYVQFSGSTAQFHVKGDIQSLNYGVNYKNQTVTKNYAFKCVFSGCTGLTRADELIMPSSSAGTQSMRLMFDGCTNLLTPPELPATSVGSSGYSNMFSNCTSLTVAPDLPATSISNNAYWSMFSGCTSLVYVPKILPAKTLASECYLRMFQGCTSLEKSPILPAETMAATCYKCMFSGCTNLNEIWCDATGNTTAHTEGWVDGVAETGKFHENDKLPTNWTRGIHGIPYSWSADRLKNCLTIVARTSGEIIKNSHSGTFYYSVDSGETWVSATSATSIAVEAGDRVMFKGELAPNTSSDPFGIGCFSATTCEFDVEGNPMSLLFGDNFSTWDNFNGKTYAFASMFRACTGLINAENLILNSKTGTTDCYYMMFANCTNMVKAPKKIDVATYAGSAVACNGMFRGCTNLKKAPVLLAETMADRCYHYMFYGCTSLEEITCYATGVTNTTAYTDHWVDGVAPNGKFYKNMEKVTTWGRGVNGIPAAWGLPELDNYFAIKAVEDSVVRFSWRDDSFYYSLDEGVSWQPYTTANADIPLEAGKRVLWQTQHNSASGTFYTFSATTGNIEVEGNAMSFVWGDNYNLQPTHKTGAFRGLFDMCTALTSAENLDFTEAQMGWRTCNIMFSGCTNLEKAPKILPALTLGQDCYNVMFCGCTKLEKSPILPAETAGAYSYNGMFSGCTNLNEIWCYATNASTANSQYWVDGVAPTGTFHKNEDKVTNWVRGIHGIPTTWGADKTDYLTIEAITQCSIKFTRNVYWSFNSGETWTSIPANTDVALEAGKTIMFNAIQTPTNGSPYDGVGLFSGSTGTFKAYGNPKSLQYGDNFSDDTPHKYRGCQGMFKGCTGLTDCSGLIFPELLEADDVYAEMFSGCTNLVSVPQYVGKDSRNEARWGMFCGCINLEKAPILPAETIVTNDYNHMFSGCTKLNEIWCYATGVTTAVTSNWVVGVAPTGVFHKKDDTATAWNRGVNGIPAGWTVDGVEGYFTIVAETNCSIKMTTAGHFGSKDSGATWFEMGTSAWTLNEGEELMMNSTITPNGGGEPYGVGTFSGSTGLYHVKGNAQSLNYGDNFVGQNAVKARAFSNLFRGCTGLTRADELILTGDTFLGASSYDAMFYKASNLTAAPELPATTLANNCYAYMFEGCTSLEKAPILPAEAVSAYSYYRMFSGCTSLNEITCNLVTYGDNSTTNWVSGVAPTGKFHKNMNKVTPWVRGVSGIPEAWSVPELDNYFAIKAVTNSIVRFSWRNDTFYYSVNEGQSWSKYATANAAIPVEAGKRVLFQTQYGGGTGTVYSFSATTGNIEAEGNIMSFVWGDNYNLQPAHKVGAYRNLFLGCTALTSCENLDFTDAAMGNRTCDGMFYNASNLTAAPELPATTLDVYCYAYMFYGCTSLEKAPILPAETMATQCYIYMFSGCTMLNEITCYATGITTAQAEGWVNGVAANGVFHKNMDKITTWTRGVSGIPAGWGVPELDNYFAIKAVEDSVVKFSYRDNTFYYSLDEGESWLPYTTANAGIPLESGERVLWQTQYGGGENTVYSFSATTGNIEAEGNVMSFVWGDNYNLQSTHKTGAFRCLFQSCTALTSCENIEFTDATMGYRTCNAMFGDCTNLENVPAILTAKTIGQESYSYMFRGCTKIEKSPILPAETMATQCYYGMFSGCTMLNEITCYATNVSTAQVEYWVNGVAANGVFHENKTKTTNWASGVSGIPVGWMVTKYETIP